MNFYNIKNKGKSASFKEAIFKGLASSEGLYMPMEITLLKKVFFDSIFSLSLPEIGFEVSKHFLKNEIPASALEEIIKKALYFDAPLVSLSENSYVLELFEGPTLSFKDFGAQFMAGVLTYFNRHEDKTLNILAATSGDTGSAIAYSFINAPGIKVWILYPKGQVSQIQEKQLTTMGSNVVALEVEGSFDDCQRLVKQAFSDHTLKVRLTSANSINIARLIPQSFYYFYAYAQLKNNVGDLVFSVPSGNFGNLTAGLLAKRMGLPISKFIAATNVNDSVPKYLESGKFLPHPSKPTLSNAMDVGNPSNFARMLDLYEGNVERMRQDIVGFSFTDIQTKEAINEIYRSYHYIADPHGAVAYLGLKNYQEREKCLGIFLETAHPAKFSNIVEPLLNHQVEMPERLKDVLSKESIKTLLPNDYAHFKEMLIKNCI